MRRFIVPSIAIAVVAIGAVGYAADLQSGLQVGDFPGPYHVRDCTGPSAGKTLCYR